MLHNYIMWAQLVGPIVCLQNTLILCLSAFYSSSEKRLKPTRLCCANFHTQHLTAPWLASIGTVSLCKTYSISMSPVESLSNFVQGANKKWERI